MKIVKAMKKIARLQGEIKDVKHRMQNCLSTAIDNEYRENFDELKKILFSKINDVISLKVKIMHANVKNGMFQHVLAMGELKGYMTFLKELDPKTGVDIEQYRYSEGSIKFKAQLSVSEKNKLAEVCQTEINRLTDLLDDFNASTNLEEMDVVAHIA